MGGPLFDCYVLAPKRTAQTAMEFLDRFLPEREAQFDLSDPSDVLGIPRNASAKDIFPADGQALKRSDVTARALAARLASEELTCPHCRQHAKDIRFVEPSRSELLYFSCGSLL